MLTIRRPRALFLLGKTESRMISLRKIRMQQWTMVRIPEQVYANALYILSGGRQTSVFQLYIG